VDGAIIASPAGPVGTPLSPLDFVTGPSANVGGSRYGWIASNELPFLALDTSSNPGTGFLQGFETDNSGWDVFTGQFVATRVPSGTSGVSSGTGGFHGVAGRSEYDKDGGSAFCDWGSDRNVRCAFPTGEGCSQPDCDDGNVCTDDICDPVEGCVQTPRSCDDRDACTADACNPSSGCTHAPLGCDDGNACTDDGCNPASGCTHVDNTASCDDSNACTVADVCSGGACSGAPRSCDDGNACTDDGCNPASGCTNVNNTIPCNDGNACTVGDVCGAGATATIRTSVRTMGATRRPGART
jgi:hypothetical protein